VTSSTGRKNRSYAPRLPAEQRRTQLLDATLHLVVTRGHGAVTMEAVAERAGVTKPVVYGMYPNRGELLAALLRREANDAVAQVLEALPGEFDEPVADVPAALAAVFGRFLDIVRGHQDRWYCVVMPMPGLPLEFHTARDQARQLLIGRTQQLAEGLLRSLGAPSALDPEIVAHTLVTLFEMAARLMLTEPERFAPERFTAALHTALKLAI
jgi:AcrR family transcriptional regulator